MISALQIAASDADKGHMSPFASEMRTVTLSPQDLRLIRNLVEHAWTQCSPSDMKRVIDLDRLHEAIDAALHAG